MARDTGVDADPVIQDLLAYPQRYSYFQAVRLLRLLTHKSRACDFDSFSHHNLRVRALLSLGLPANDLSAIECIIKDTDDDDDLPETVSVHDDGSPVLVHEPEIQYRLTATFLGLYGPSSPLPTAYTEELFDEANDDLSVTRDFLDILGDGYFADFFRSWSKYRLMTSVIEEQSPDVLTMLYCLLGFGHQELKQGKEQQIYRMLRYIGIFSQYPRSAEGIKILLQDFLGAKQVQVIPNLKKKVKIPHEQRCKLGVNGHALGEDAYLGEELWDGMSAFLILIAGASAKAYYDNLPGSQGWDFLRWLIRVYVQSPLDYDLKISLRPGQAQTATLGSWRWSGLGYNTWLLSDQSTEAPVAYLSHRDGGSERPLQSRNASRSPD